MTQGITMTTILADDYRNDFKEAMNPKRMTLNPAPLALKLIEEAIEAALAAGIKLEQVEAACQIFVGREKLRLDPTKDGIFNYKAARDELADCDIVHRTMRGLLGISDGLLGESVIEKRLVNRNRLWRVNEFGTLSNMGLKDG